MQSLVEGEQVAAVLEMAQMSSPYSVPILWMNIYFYLLDWSDFLCVRLIFWCGCWGIRKVKRGVVKWLVVEKLSWVVWEYIRLIWMVDWLEWEGGRINLQSCSTWHDMDGAAVVVVHRALVARRFLWRREALEMARNVVRRMERSIGKVEIVF